jgi:hypothetical protein
MVMENAMGSRKKKAFPEGKAFLFPMIPVLRAKRHTDRASRSDRRP